MDKEKNEALKKVLVKWFGLSEVDLDDEILEDYLIFDEYMVLTEYEAKDKAITAIKKEISNYGYDSLGVMLEHYINQGALLSLLFDDIWLEKDALDYTDLKVELEKYEVNTMDKLVEKIVENIDNECGVLEYYQNIECDLNTLIQRDNDVVDEESLISDLLATNGLGYYIGSYDDRDYEVEVDGETYVVLRMK